MGQGIIMTLLDTFGPLSTKQLAKALGMRPSSVSRSLHGLEQAGEVASLRGHGLKGGSLIFWVVT